MPDGQKKNIHLKDEIWFRVCIFLAVQGLGAKVATIILGLGFRGKSGNHNIRFRV